MEVSIRVALVEDQAPLRQALGLLLQVNPKLTLTGSYPSAEDALESLDAAPDVVLLDIGLPGRSGIEALPLLREKWSGAEFLMLTVEQDEGRIYDALCAGASGYLLKSTPADRLLAAIEELQAGGAPMSASVARKVVKTFRAPQPEGEPLTPREKDVLDLLVMGKSNREIADSLFVSTNTVATHIKGIYAKLHVRSRAEAIARLRPVR